EEKARRQAARDGLHRQEADPQAGAGRDQEGLGESLPAVRRRPERREVATGKQPQSAQRTQRSFLEKNSQRTPRLLFVSLTAAARGFAQRVVSFLPKEPVSPQ